MLSIGTALALSPHSDDIEAGCGGTLARLRREGAEVHIAVFSFCSESVPAGFPNDVLRHEFADSMARLGIVEENRILHDFPVRHFPAYRQEILEVLVHLNRRLQPDIVFAPSQDDIHQDHSVVCQEARRAFKRTTSFGYELPWNNSRFRNDCFFRLERVDVEMKISVCQAYKSQSQRLYGDGNFIWDLARLRGLQAGSDWAEAFELMRLVS